ncbi:MAG: hypothetical protein IJJ71_11600 [Treponema sp.]|uniref:PBECR4 domain-containing protein n=1 Tax=Treponema sp. TaxID=166 RepID=UPI0025EC8E12|nr:PBECR4 domain-containing protein [Treponema sp.]MBR0100080.1 hypothetical protein [Treponema sp.]MBR0496807.1 hypothetical protein [Treponema sp.]
MHNLSPAFGGVLFLGATVDLLLQCAKNYEQLLNCKYHFVIGRKGVLYDFELTFQKTDFHHLAGLHKLTDKRILQHNARNTIHGPFSITAKMEPYKTSLTANKISKYLAKCPPRRVAPELPLAVMSVSEGRKGGSRLIGAEKNKI